MMCCDPHEYKVNQTHEVSLREATIGYWFMTLLNKVLLNN